MKLKKRPGPTGAVEPVKKKTAEELACFYRSRRFMTLFINIIINEAVYTTEISTNVNQRQIDTNVSPCIYCAKVFRYIKDPILNL
jgi:hypothetical protein